MTASWKTAVVSALQRYGKRHGSLQVERGAFLRDELTAMVAETASGGRTPAQTVSRVLQELRDEGTLYFSEAGVYVITGAAVDAVAEEFPDDVLEHAARSGTLVLTDVATSDAISLLRARRGMAAVRRATLLNYRGCCALCDIADTRLLVASHIARWADRPEARGLLANVICLCSLHDPLFEQGYFALSDELAVELALIRQPTINSQAIRSWADSSAGTFRPPLQQAPCAGFLQEHRTRVGL